MDKKKESAKLKSALSVVLRVGGEHTVETFYNFSPTPWLWFACDLQVVRPVLKTSSVAVIPGARMVINF